MPVNYSLAAVDGDPFGEYAALTQGAAPIAPPVLHPALSMPAIRPPIGAPLDDFDTRAPAAPPSNIRLTPVAGNPFAGAAISDPPLGRPDAFSLRDIAMDPSRSMFARVPAAIGTSLGDQAAAIGRGAWNAFTLPGDVARGVVDPNSLASIRRSADLAGFATSPLAGAQRASSNVLGALGGGAASASLSLEDQMRALLQKVGKDPEPPPVGEQIPFHTEPPSSAAPIPQPGLDAAINRIANGERPGDVMLDTGWYQNRQSGQWENAHEMPPYVPAPITSRPEPKRANLDDTLTKAGMSRDDLAKSMFGKYGVDSQGAPTHEFTAFPWGGAEMSAVLRNPDTGERIGRTTRNFDPETNSVSHTYFKLGPDVQGADVGKDLLRQQVDTYNKMGLDTVHLHANIDVGGYAWGKYGFVPSQSSWDSVRADMKPLLDVYREGGLDDETHSAVMDMLNSSDPKTLWKISDLTTPAYDSPFSRTSQPLGKALLLGTDWNGSLNLKDAESMNRFNTYVSKPKKASTP